MNGIDRIGSRRSQSIRLSSLVIRHSGEAAPPSPLKPRRRRRMMTIAGQPTSRPDGAQTITTMLGKALAKASKLPALAGEALDEFRAGKTAALDPDDL